MYSPRSVIDLTTFVAEDLCLGIYAILLHPVGTNVIVVPGLAGLYVSFVYRRGICLNLELAGGVVFTVSHDLPVRDIHCCSFYINNLSELSHSTGTGGRQPLLPHARMRLHHNAHLEGGACLP